MKYTFCHFKNISKINFITHFFIGILLYLLLLLNAYLADIHWDIMDHTIRILASILYAVAAGDYCSVLHKAQYDEVKVDIRQKKETIAVRNLLTVKPISKKTLLLLKKCRYKEYSKYDKNQNTYTLYHKEEELSEKL